MSIDTNPNMWRYWVDKYGPVEALESYYPALLASDPVLAQAVAMHNVALLAINARMEQIVSTWPEQG
jgi:hypothetical protein